MKSKDKKIAQYEIENRKAIQNLKYCAEHTIDYFEILQKGGPSTPEEEKIVKIVGERYREKSDEELELEQDRGIKRYIALHEAAETKKEEALKRKRFEKAMKAAADKQKREKAAAEEKKKNNENKTE